MIRLLFIGAGKMATAIAAGMTCKGGFEAGNIIAVDVSCDAGKLFTEATGARCCQPENFPRGYQPDVILLAVKPQCVTDAFANFAKEACGSLIVSIAAGVKISRLKELAGSGRIIRGMPNTPLLVGSGVSVYSPGPETSPSDEKTVESIFGPLGLVKRMPEEQMDAVTAMSGSGPAYIFEMIQAMADAGVSIGLAPADALDLAVYTVEGAARMLIEGKGTPDGLRKAVTSPGGTTAAALSVLSQGDFRGLIKSAILAARDRSIELGRT